VRDLLAAAGHLERVDGVMLGRAVYDDPTILAEADRTFYPELPDGYAEPPSRRHIIERMLPYLEERLADGAPLHALTRHLLPMFRGVPGGKRWRRHLTEGVQRPGAGADLVIEGLALLPSPALDARPAAAPQPA